MRADLHVETGARWRRVALASVEMTNPYVQHHLSWFLGDFGEWADGLHLHAYCVSEQRMQTLRPIEQRVASRSTVVFDESCDQQRSA